MPKISLNINCGKTTCFATPNHPCQLLGSRKMGQQWVCMLFPSLGNAYTDLEEDKNGWLQRCSACLEASKEEKQ